LEILAVSVCLSASSSAQIRRFSADWSMTCPKRKQYITSESPDKVHKLGKYLLNVHANRAFDVQLRIVIVQILGNGLEKRHGIVASALPSRNQDNVNTVSILVYQ
jgi:aspartokinase